MLKSNLNSMFNLWYRRRVSHEVWKQEDFYRYLDYTNSEDHAYYSVIATSKWAHIEHNTISPVDWLRVLEVKASRISKHFHHENAQRKDIIRYSKQTWITSSSKIHSLLMQRRTHIRWQNITYIYSQTYCIMCECIFHHRKSKPTETTNYYISLKLLNK